MSVSTLYLAGPMTGYAEHNFPAFHAATEQLEATGRRVLSPAVNGYGEQSWADYLRRDLRLVLDAEGVAVLPGWESSRGAQLEVHTALALDMPVRTVPGWLPGVGGHDISTPASMPTQNEVHEWLAHNFGPERSVVDQALVVVEEVGEMCRVLVKRAQGIRGTTEEWTAEVRKESADAVIALLSVAGTEGFDLPTAVAERWETVSRRDFSVDPVGHGLPAA